MFDGSTGVEGPMQPIKPAGFGLGAAEGYPVKQTRSGKSYAVEFAYSVLKLPRSFDLPALLKESTAVEDRLADDRKEDQPPLPLPSSTPACQGNCVPIRAAQSSAAPTASWSNSRPAGVTTSLKHEIRKRQRQAARAERGPFVRPEILKKYVIPAASAPHLAELNISELPATSGAYAAKPEKTSSADALWTPERLVEELGFEHKRWNGIDPFVVVNQDDCIHTYFVGRPDDETYLKDAEGFYDVMKEEGVANLGPITTHRRGRFHAINAGIMHNNGTTSPINLDNRGHTEMVDRLLADRRLQRLVNFSTASFQAWAPKLFAYYQTYLNALFEKMPQLRRIFGQGIFTTAAFNFGPNVCTFKHRDISNLPFGMCAVQALGRFNPKTGGQIILWEPRLVVDFPPASLIFIQSATITHSNCPIAEGEERGSFTQYCPGGIFRWVDYGFRLEKDLKIKDPVLYRKVIDLRPHRWALGLQLLSKPQDFTSIALNLSQVD